MGQPAYLSLKGQSVGKVEGSITETTHERKGKIGVISVSHEIVAPRDPATGHPTGRRLHKPLVITKELDKASPLLYQLLCKNENVTEWELQFFMQGASGGAQQHYTIKLTNANVASINFRMPNTKADNSKQSDPYEEVAFVYQKIDWIWTGKAETAAGGKAGGAIVADDNWEAQV